MTMTSFVFTELTNTMKYGGGFLYNLFFTEWRHCVSQNRVDRRRASFYRDIASFYRDIASFYRDIASFYRDIATMRRNPANTGHSPNTVSMLGQRRRRWANIETASGECLNVNIDLREYRPEGA